MGNADVQKAKLNYVCACFIVDDIVKTAEYYRDVLDFRSSDIGASRRASS